MFTFNIKDGREAPQKPSVLKDIEGNKEKEKIN